MSWQSYLQEFDDLILDILLRDKTTGKPLVFPPDQTSGRPSPFLGLEDLYGVQSQKDMPDEAEEVQTLCSWNRKLNQLDEVWFQRSGVFNTPTAEGWIPAADPVYFEDPFHWKKYVNQQIYVPDLDWGAALTFAGTSENLPLNERMGQLDRELRLVNENVRSQQEWQKRTSTMLARMLGCAKDPIRLFRARLCVLETCREAFQARFGHLPSARDEKALAHIVARNLFQSEDELNTVPFQEMEETLQLSLFEESLPGQQQMMEMAKAAMSDSSPMVQMPVRVHRPISQRTCTLAELRKSMERKPQNWRILSLETPQTEDPAENSR